MAAVYKHIQRSNLHYVIEFDIKGFFDNVNHSKLIKQIWALGIRDKGLIYVIKRILKAPIRLEDGTIIIPDKGTPQGGIISPLLANIVLNELERWVESQWQDNPVTKKYKIRYKANGSPDKGDGYGAMKKTRLKEMRIVRYADDFRILCRRMDDALNIMAAVKQWLWERLRLEVSPKKTRVINLKKQYSEFLGIKIRLKRKKKKLVVQSHICDKAIGRIQIVARDKMKEIARPPKGKTKTRAILDYSSYVMGVHNYYQMATDVSLDLNKIGFYVNKTARRIGKCLKRKPKSKTTDAVVKRYGMSEQLRWIGDLPIAPIAYVQTKAPMFKKRSVQKYTPEGRKEIHANLGMNTNMLRAMLRQQIYGRSAEYADNRLSLYCAQYGKCAVTGQEFELLEDLHCHHKLPRRMGGKDNYQNLILVREGVHILIHATTQPTIDKYLASFSLSKNQLNKLNKLRKEAGNQPIVA